MVFIFIAGILNNFVLDDEKRARVDSWEVTIVWDKQHYYTYSDDMLQACIF